MILDTQVHFLSVASTKIHLLGSYLHCRLQEMTIVLLSDPDLDIRLIIRKDIFRLVQLESFSEALSVCVKTMHVDITANFSLCHNCTVVCRNALFQW